MEIPEPQLALLYLALGRPHCGTVHSQSRQSHVADGRPAAQTLFRVGRTSGAHRAEYGNIYDHHAVCYEWDNGVKVFAYTRQMKGCASDVDDYILGTKGQAQVLIKAARWSTARPYYGDKPSMYDQEHKELFAAIRAGTPINNGRYMSLSTMMAIIGREACYTGEMLNWDEAINADMRLGPTTYEWGDVKAAPWRCQASPSSLAPGKERLGNNCRSPLIPGRRLQVERHTRHGHRCSAVAWGPRNRHAKSRSVNDRTESGDILWHRP